MTDEDEFMIAADLTLYSNPLNRLLCRRGPEPEKSEADTPSNKASGSHDEHQIAADMKQYTNPLAELDKFHKDEKK